jgi:hypothetical protein
MLDKVVDSLADKDRVLASFVLERNTLPVFPLLQESVPLPECAACCDDAVRGAEHSIHALEVLGDGMRSVRKCCGGSSPHGCDKAIYSAVSSGDVFRKKMRSPPLSDPLSRTMLGRTTGRVDKVRFTTLWLWAVSKCLSQRRMMLS